MIISESWLKTWVNSNLSATEIAEVLTMSGIEVDSIKTMAPEFSNVVLGKILNIRKHPNADRLNICTVFTGEELEIICGAKNVSKNMFVACALSGAKLPGKISIKKTKMRGVLSNGMLCSEQELGISNDSEGIMELKQINENLIGKNIREILNLDEKILDLKITPNRGDCLSVRGVARELAASTKSKMKNPIEEFEKNNNFNSAVACPKISIKNQDLCGRFSARVITNVNSKVKTPDWIVTKLKQAGQKQISVLVDISNYIMLELGRPSHIFDYDCISRNSYKSIEVRWANSDENIELLNSETVKCSNSIGVIADCDGPIAIAGIMGGQRTSVSKYTKNILIETAFWWPDAIRGKAQQIKILTDAAHRFERGVDFESTLKDLEIISNLIISVCGGELGKPIDLISKSPTAKKILFRKSRCEKVLGIKVSLDQVQKIFDDLKMSYQKVDDSNDQCLNVTPPTYRFDIQIEEDLIEEVIRIIGYDNIPSVSPISNLTPKALSENALSFQDIKDNMVNQDFFEVINYGFVDKNLSNKFISKRGEDNRHIELINPISSNMTVMRKSLIPSLIEVLRNNINHQQKRIRIFELARVFLDNEECIASTTSTKGINQPYLLSALVYGSAFSEQWGVNERDVDFFDMKKIFENTILSTKLEFQNSYNLDFLHPGRSAMVVDPDYKKDRYNPFNLINENVLGFIGEIHPIISSSLNISKPPIVFEIYVSSLIDKTLPKHSMIPRVPSVRRDLAFVVPKQINAGSIEKYVLKNKNQFEFGEILKQFSLFDVYTGSGLNETQKSLAFMVLMQDTEKTLEDKLVQSLIEEIVKIVTANFPAELRS